MGTIGEKWLLGVANATFENDAPLGPRDLRVLSPGVPCGNKVKAVLVYFPMLLQIEQEEAVHEGLSLRLHPILHPMFTSLSREDLLSAAQVYVRMCSQEYRDNVSFCDEDVEATHARSQKLYDKYQRAVENLRIVQSFVNSDMSGGSNPVEAEATDHEES